MTVTITELMRSAVKDKEARPKFPNEIRRELERKNARSAVRIARPAAAIPMQ
jgi:hypothetical protein